jgi:hypothetical protein
VTVVVHGSNAKGSLPSTSSFLLFTTDFQKPPRVFVPAAPWPCLRYSSNYLIDSLVAVPCIQCCGWRPIFLCAIEMDDIDERNGTQANEILFQLSTCNTYLLMDPLPRTRNLFLHPLLVLTPDLKRTASVCIGAAFGNIPWMRCWKEG